MRHATYAHTQDVKLLRAMPLAMTVGVAVSLLAEKGTAGWPGVALLLAVNVIVPLALRHFTVEVGQGRAKWHFGVLGWPRGDMALDRITSLNGTNSIALEGWGRLRTKTGVPCDAQGLQAACLELRDGCTLRPGRDEPERLAALMTARQDPRPPARTTPR